MTWKISLRGKLSFVKVNLQAIFEEVAKYTNSNIYWGQLDRSKAVIPEKHTVSTKMKGAINMIRRNCMLKGPKTKVKELLTGSSLPSSTHIYFVKSECYLSRSIELSSTKIKFY